VNNVIERYGWRVDQTSHRDGSNSVLKCMYRCKLILECVCVCVDVYVHVYVGV
jgi:hypothetical protein